jgi:hypothetical protein
MSRGGTWVSSFRLRSDFSVGLAPLLFVYLSLLLFGLGEEVDEVLLPDGGGGVGAVAAGGVGDGDEDEFGVRHLRG